MAGPRGFSDSVQTAIAPDGSASAGVLRDTLKVGEAGRIVIPASMREAMGVTPGDSLIARVEDGELRLMSRRTALRRVQLEMGRLKRPGESVVDEFLAERQALWGEK